MADRLAAITGQKGVAFIVDERGQRVVLAKGGNRQQWPTVDRRIKNRLGVVGDVKAKVATGQVAVG
ncbi:hypothetical protein D3C78_1544160 [compost metagenome]